MTNAIKILSSWGAASPALRNWYIRPAIKGVVIEISERASFLGPARVVSREISTVKIDFAQFDILAYTCGQLIVEIEAAK